MYQRALKGFDKALGSEHTSTLIVANNLDNLYISQGNVEEVEAVFQRAKKPLETKKPLSRRDVVASCIALRSR